MEAEVVEQMVELLSRLERQPKVETEKLPFLFHS